MGKLHDPKRCGRKKIESRFWVFQNRRERGGGWEGVWSFWVCVVLVDFQIFRFFRLFFFPSKNWLKYRVDTYTNQQIINKKKKHF